MCGIAGIVSERSIEDQGKLLHMRDAMRHRGPDDAGIWWTPDKRLGLAHRRLSIIDPSPAGHQPMEDCTGELCIVFNGEIYNFSELRRELKGKGHAFRSHSDTEVLLAAYREWGTACLSRLNGMFAFALYDSRKREVFIARDRAGEKPLFYTLANGGLSFASELKGLMADPAISRKIDPEAMDCYLAMGYIPGDRCIFKGCKKLPAGHALVYKLESRQSRVWCYWNLPEPNASLVSQKFDEEELLDELDSILEDAVRKQLVADVPVGVLLSGGVDSSLITAMAARNSANVKTFTLRFPEHGAYDETEHARLVARHFGTEHIELVAPESSVDLLPKLACQFDEPMVDSSMIPTYLVSELIRENCTVALGGDGGDELFGGYRHHGRLQWVQENLGVIPHSFRSAVAKGAGFCLPVGTKGRNWLQSLDVDLRTGLPLIGSLFDGRTRRQLMSQHSESALVADRIWEQRTPQERDLLSRATKMDFSNFLVEDILVKVDRSSMLNSLEIRAPLLDYRLIEFAFGKVPPHLKATTDARKILPKKLTSRLLPPEFDRDRKAGFCLPLSSWLESGPWSQFFRDVLMESDGSFFDQKTIAKLFAGQTKGRMNSERLFALVFFELWRREYNATF